MYYEFRLIQKYKCVQCHGYSNLNVINKEAGWYNVKNKLTLRNSVSDSPCQIIMKMYDSILDRVNAVLKARHVIQCLCCVNKT